jgi:hypothetical protein
MVKALPNKGLGRSTKKEYLKMPINDLTSNQLFVAVLAASIGSIITALFTYMTTRMTLKHSRELWNAERLERLSDKYIRDQKEEAEAAERIKAQVKRAEKNKPILKIVSVKTLRLANGRSHQYNYTITLRNFGGTLYHGLLRAPWTKESKEIGKILSKGDRCEIVFNCKEPELLNPLTIIYRGKNADDEDVLETTMIHVENGDYPKHSGIMP